MIEGNCIDFNADIQYYGYQISQSNSTLDGYSIQYDLTIEPNIGCFHDFLYSFKITTQESSTDYEINSWNMTASTRGCTEYDKVNIVGDTYPTGVDQPTSTDGADGTIYSCGYYVEIGYDPADAQTGYFTIYSNQAASIAAGYIMAVAFGYALTL